jgi:F-type H+/Na+-transporting ATPase subunit alpha
VEEQVVAIFAVTRGLMDTIPVPKTKAFESYLLETLRNHTPEILQAIKAKSAIEDENALAEKVKEIAADFLRKN